MNSQEFSETIAQMIRDQEAVRERRKKAGVPALHRLVQAAQGGGGQAYTLRQFLLGLYNSPEWPFDLYRLRGLDPELQTDCLAVLTLDWCGREVHQYIEGGDDLFLAWWKEARP